LRTSRKLTLREGHSNLSYESVRIVKFSCSMCSNLSVKEFKDFTYKVLCLVVSSKHMSLLFSYVNKWYK